MECSLVHILMVYTQLLVHVLKSIPYIYVQCRVSFEQNIDLNFSPPSHPHTLTPSQVPSSSSSQWQLRTLPLSPLTPVPSDIAVARSQTPKHISELASEIGLLERELEMYGPHKAKVSLSVLERLKNQPNGR